ncbi:N-acetylmuramoyl-L-alanine amidase [Desulfoscipio geothermicus]|uniref:N-acetylmuramoyl-L-alanine amidase n=1 Tax=Desulfoscipio geothermicus DSM 3669 TaxID=1121426 RepID=A0A1I6D033_9FIRM|nr:N-acetylmuramoyl-L-alanine amidase [Desulfoscipio geothermicus]SFQ98720.1 N-acetylmuramoyl-L-alanine amidase [Desulfoscipio geothermicus DSM 3669]
MLIIVLDPGHGGSDPGAINGKHYEKAFNLTIATETARYLNDNYSAAVHFTRIADTTMGLYERAGYANELNADYFVSLHINAGGGTGFESYIHTSAGSTTHKYRDILHNRIADFYRSKGFPDRGKKSANFAVLRETGMSAVLLENLFIDNGSDLSFLLKSSFLKQLGTAIGDGIARALQLKTKTPGSGTIPARMPATALTGRARQLLKSRNPAAPDYIDIYVKMGEIYRIRWDAVFAQSCKETAFWRFGGDVRPQQNNFAGLGAFNGKEGASFATPEEGIEAQFQHWHAYYHGGKLPPGRPSLDPRRNAVLSTGWAGALNFVEDLGGRWAPAQDYGVSIVRDYMAKFMDEVIPGPIPTPPPVPTPPEPSPAPDSPANGGGWNPEAEIDRLKKDGLIVNDHAPDAPVTWGEFAAVINRLRDRLTSGDSNDNPTSPGNQPPDKENSGNKENSGEEYPAKTEEKELLQNGDFSQNSQGWEINDTYIQTEANGNKYGVSNYTWRFRQDFPVNPGWKIIFNGRTRNGGSPNAARVVIGFINYSGTLKVVSDIRHTHQGNGWESFPRQELTVPSHAVKGRVFLLTNGGTGVHHFDDISIKKL